MKKHLIILAALIALPVLSACSDEGGAADAVGFLQQNFKEFSINIPENWRRINPDNFANTIPEGTMAIFLSPTTTADFIQNTNIVQESLNTDATSLEYAKANMLLGSKAIVDYRPVSGEEVEINNVKTVFHVFRARNVSTDPLRYYTQSYFVQDRVGYTVTCIAQDEEVAQQQSCETMVKSFGFTN